MPFDLTVHEKTLRNVALRRTDFVNEPKLGVPTFLDKIIRRAEKIPDKGFQQLAVTTGSRFGKTTYKVSSFEHELVLRLLSKSVSRLTGVRQSNRIEIIKSLKVILAEGVDYRVYRLDIRSFFESVHVETILTELRGDHGFSRQGSFLLDAFFEKLSSLDIPGLPRGISLSPVLAEYALRRFDKDVLADRNVYFYSRFVDDIVLITSGRESPKHFLKQRCRELPFGLTFNSNKTQILEFMEPISGRPFTKKLDFLGYELSVRNRSKPKPISRRVTADISASKTKKLKTRIVKSALQYLQDSQFDDFIDRIKLLSGNVTIYDHAREIRRKSGIHYNYRLIDAESSTSLPELDSYLRRFLLSNSGPISSKLSAKLSNAERRQLLKISFVKGFVNRTFFHFRGDRLAHLMKCWEYV